MISCLVMKMLEKRRKKAALLGRSIEFLSQRFVLKSIWEVNWKEKGHLDLRLEISDYCKASGVRPAIEISPNIFFFIHILVIYILSICTFTKFILLTLAMISTGKWTRKTVLRQLTLLGKHSLKQKIRAAVCVRKVRVSSNLSLCIFFIFESLAR